jgi:hypothetical protein
MYYTYITPMAYVIGWPKGAFEVLPGMDAEE